MRVAGGTDSESTAGAIAKVFQNGESDKVDLECIGAPAVNQAVKAIIMARTMTAAQGMNLITIPAFRDVDFEGVKKTGVTLKIRNLD